MGNYKVLRWEYIKFVIQWVKSYIVYRYWMIFFYINRNKVESWDGKNVYIMGKWLFIVHSDDVARRGDHMTFKSRQGDYKIVVEDDGVEYLYHSVVSFWVHKRQEYFFQGNDVGKYLSTMAFSVHVWCGNTAQSWGINRELVKYFHDLYCPKDMDWESFSLNYKRGRNLRSLL